MDTLLLAGSLMVLFLCCLALFDRLSRKKKREPDASNGKNELERLKGFYKEIGELTIHHEVIDDCACVTAEKLGDALARVDRNWQHRFRAE